MSYLLNPFKPNSAASNEFFVGRNNLINHISRSLHQTKANQSQSFMVLGERGIGKTSLLLNTKNLAEGVFKGENSKLNFFVITIDITKETSRASLIKNISDAFDRKLSKIEKTKFLFKETWSFLSRIEAAGFKINSPEIDNLTLFESFSYSLAQTVKRITESDRKKKSAFDGVIILLDEVDNINKKVQLGEFIKLVIERLQKEDTEKLMFGLFGLPETKKKLIESHRSVGRMFNELTLSPLDELEMEQLLINIKENCQRLNNEDLLITTKAKEFLFSYSRGFPHFFHYYGYYAFEESSNGRIDFEIIQRGAFNNAIDRLEYIYNDDMYKDIREVENYRLLLQEFAFELDKWLSHKELVKRYLGDKSKINELVKKLENRKIIRSEGKLNNKKYKLIEQGFGWWILINQYKFEETNK